MPRGSCRVLDRLDVIKRRADVLEQLADDRAKEDQGNDNDDRDQGEKQSVLNESLTILVLALEASQKSADEVLDHVGAVPPFRKNLCRQRMQSIRQVIWPNGPATTGRVAYLAPRTHGSQGLSTSCGYSEGAAPCEDGSLAPEEETRDRCSIHRPLNEGRRRYLRRLGPHATRVSVRAPWNSRTRSARTCGWFLVRSLGLCPRLCGYGTHRPRGS